MKNLLIGGVFLFVSSSAFAADVYTRRGNNAYGDAGTWVCTCDHDPNGNGDGSYSCHYETRGA